MDTTHGTPIDGHAVQGHPDRGCRAVGRVVDLRRDHWAGRDLERVALHERLGAGALLAEGAAALGAVLAGAVVVVVRAPVAGDCALGVGARGVDRLGVGCLGRRGEA